METVGDFKIPEYADAEATGWASEENLNAHALATIAHGLRDASKVGTASHYLKDISGGVELYAVGDPSDTLIATFNDNGSFELKSAIIGTETDNTTIEADGTPIFNGNATTWEDENFDPTMLTGGGHLPTLTVLGSTGLHIAGFSGLQIDEVEFCKEYPHKAKLNSVGGTTVKFSFHAHARPATNSGGNIRLGLEYIFCKEGVTLGSSTTIYLVDSVPATAWERKTFTFPDITAPDSLGTQLHFRFMRLSADPLDTYTGTLGVATIGFHYESDGLGSHQVTVK